MHMSVYAQVIQMVCRYPAQMKNCLDFKCDWDTICGRGKGVSTREVIGDVRSKSIADFGPWRTLPVCVGTKQQKHLDAEMVGVHASPLLTP